MQNSGMTAQVFVEAKRVAVSRAPAGAEAVFPFSEADGNAIYPPPRFM
jgi:hypothetical protein